MTGTCTKHLVLKVSMIEMQPTRQNPESLLNAIGEFIYSKIIFGNSIDTHLSCKQHTLPTRHVCLEARATRHDPLYQHTIMPDTHHAT
jgi:hypothetical protein